MTSHPLDNPVFSALATTHAQLARVHGTARAYLEEISPFMGAEQLDEQGWRDLMTFDDSARIIHHAIGEPPPGTQTPFRAGLSQMIAPEVREVPDRYEVRPLSDADVPAMVALTALTKPGPFRAGTPRLGGYLGIFVPGAGGEPELVAMAGRRMQTPDYCEISAVCTHPNFVRRGAGTQLTLSVARSIQAEGKDAFLHVSDENPTAAALYQSIGFTVRARLEVAAVVFRPAQAPSH